MQGSADKAKRSVTLQPSPGALTISRRPPTPRARSRMLQDGRWSDVEVPEAPAAVVGLYGGRSLAEGLCVMVDRDGGVFELVGARWVRRVAPPTGEVR
jgi:hypothetical protein